MRLTLFPALFLAALTFATHADAETIDPADERYHLETNDLSLEGNILSDWPEVDASRREETEAMVCGFRNSKSFLSLREKPSKDSAEVMRFPRFANLTLTGEVSDSAQWAKISQYAIKADADGRTVPNPPTDYTAVTGWVSTRYLCNFTH